MRDGAFQLLLKRLRLRWGDVEPYFDRQTAEAFVADHERELGAHWEGDELVIRNPRWDAKRQREFSEELCVRPNRDGLFPMGDFGRALLLSLPLADWEWKELYPPLPDGPVDAETIARVLDTPLPRDLSAKNRGPVVTRLETDADVAELVDALRRVETTGARRMLGYVLAYHDRAAEAAAALPILGAYLAGGDRETRKHAAGAIAALLSRLSPDAALTAAPGLDELLARELDHEEDNAVRLELEQALGSLGRRVADDPFVAETLRLFAFLEREYDFPPPVVEETGFGYTVRYRNDVVAVEASYEWRERWTDVWVVKLVDGALPVPGGGERERPTAVVPVRAESELEAEAEALRRAPHLLRGEF